MLRLQLKKIPKLQLKNIPKLNHNRKYCLFNNNIKNWNIDDFNEIDSIYDAINKGFVCLEFDWLVYGPHALELFTYAKEGDTNQRFKEEIKCGMEQAQNASNFKKPVKCTFCTI
jgi:hypothetical protein